MKLSRKIIQLLVVMTTVIICSISQATKPVVYVPDEIIIAKTQGDALTSAKKFENEVMCVTAGSTVIFGEDGKVKIRCVDTKDENTQLSGTFTLHKTASSGNVGVKLTSDKTKSIIFTLEKAHKLLLVGKDEGECVKPYLVSEKEKKDQFVHLTYVKCLPLENVKVYKDRTALKEDEKVYVVGSKHLCFIPSMVTKPLCIDVSEAKKSYNLIISPYPSPEPKCTAPKSKTCDKPSATNQTLNGTETAKQSATPIIISVVVIVVVIIAGGVGYVMMKK